VLGTSIAQAQFMSTHQIIQRHLLGASATLILMACAATPGDPTIPSETTGVRSIESSSKSGPLMVSARDERRGRHCPQGGVAVLSGRDANGNGNLNPAEVTAVRYVCSGLPGADGADGAPGADGPPGAPGAVGNSTLVTVEKELPGATCAAGGQAISWGLDANRDGILVFNEVVGTTYVCNGIPGASAAPPLVTLTSEPAGDQCATGGQRIDLGVDANRDGLLQVGEITGTGYVCNGVAAASLSRTKITPIPKGDPACPFGGSAVQAGIDASGDGELQANEVVFDVVVCTLQTSNPIPPGSICTNGGIHYDYGLDANQNGMLETSEIETREDVCTAAACGLNGQACCTTTPACSEPAAECNQGTCRICGVIGEACCTTRPACGSGSLSVCANDNICRMCGIPGGPCCPNPLCSAPGAPNPSCGAPGYPYRCVGDGAAGVCVQCGLRGLPCCDVMAVMCGGARCTDGSSCIGQVLCE
jgi:hypothetical protein